MFVQLEIQKVGRFKFDCWCVCSDGEYVSVSLSVSVNVISCRRLVEFVVLALDDV